MSADPFHPGERDAQRRAGVQLRGAPILTEMSDQHRSFFAGLPLLFMGVLDGAGWPLATALAGSPGFMSSPDASMLHVGTLPGQDDPVSPWVRPGASAGLLGIDLSTRRRNRVNGTVSMTDEEGFTLGVRQSFGNCPRYIQAREVAARQGPGGTKVAERLVGLDPRALALIAKADTFFVASSSGVGGSDAGGMDMSHRGGLPGFVRADGDVLTIPDFRGNRYFNTLGNLLLEPRAGLLFVDFEDGSLLHLQGWAEIDWDASVAGNIQGAERVWRVHVTVAGAVPMPCPCYGRFEAMRMQQSTPIDDMRPKPARCRCNGGRLFGVEEGGCGCANRAARLSVVQAGRKPPLIWHETSIVFW